MLSQPGSLTPFHITTLNAAGGGKFPPPAAFCQPTTIIYPQQLHNKTTQLYNETIQLYNETIQYEVDFTLFIGLFTI